MERSSSSIVSELAMRLAKKGLVPTTPRMTAPISAISIPTQIGSNLPSGPSISPLGWSRQLGTHALARLMCLQCQIGQRHLPALRGADFNWSQGRLIPVVEHISGIPVWGKQPPIAPLSKCDNHRKQIFALFGERIFVTLGVRCNGSALQNTTIDELLEPRRQKISGDSDCFLKFVQ